MDLVDIDKVLDDLELHDDDDDDDHHMRQQHINQELQQHHQKNATQNNHISVTPTVVHSPHPPMSIKPQQPHRNSSSTSVNVSGVFASLNEYVNCGGAEPRLTSPPAIVAEAVIAAAAEHTADIVISAEKDARAAQPEETVHQTNGEGNDINDIKAEDEDNDDEDDDTDAQVATLTIDPSSPDAEPYAVTVPQPPAVSPTSSSSSSPSSSSSSIQASDDRNVSALISPSSTATSSPPPSSRSATSAEPLVVDDKNDDGASSDADVHADAAEDVNAIVVAVKDVNIGKDAAEAAAAVMSSSVAAAATAIVSAVPEAPTADDDDGDDAADAAAIVDATAIEAEPSSAQAEAASATATVTAIGYDGATMDDVSDAELESYLQELELETSVVITPAVATSPPPAESPSTVRNNNHQRHNDDRLYEPGNDDDERQNDAAVADHDNNNAAAAAEEEVEDAAADDDDRGGAAMNVDSFSQASTVEYADDRQQTTTKTTAETSTRQHQQPNFVDVDDNDDGKDDDSDDDDDEGNRADLRCAELAALLLAHHETDELEAYERPITTALVPESAAGRRPDTLPLADDAKQHANPAPDTPYPSGLNVEQLGADSTPNEQAPQPPHTAAKIVITQPTFESSTTTSEPRAENTNAEKDPNDNGAHKPCDNINDSCTDANDADDNEPPPLQQQQHTRPVSILIPSGQPIATQPLLGTVQPYWIPDGDTAHCMLCQARFSLLRRRHHCRACGLVLCAACCALRVRLAYMADAEGRVCAPCAETIAEQRAEVLALTAHRRAASGAGASGDGHISEADDALQPAAEAVTASRPLRAPNPNNPMEYCSQVSPAMLAAAAAAASTGGHLTTPPIAVMVPVSVLKRTNVPPVQHAGSTTAATAAAATTTTAATSSDNTVSTTKHSSQSAAQRSHEARRSTKSVMFSDGIRPGCDLAELDTNWNAAPPVTKKTVTAAAAAASSSKTTQSTPQSPPPPQTKVDKVVRQQQHLAFQAHLPPIDAHTRSYIPHTGHALPPTCADATMEAAATATATTTTPVLQQRFVEVRNDAALIARLQRGETLRFAVQRNLYVLVRIVTLSCCVNKTVINYTSSGLHTVGQDEIVVLLETDATTEPHLPKDVLHHLNAIYLAAADGRSDACIGELGFSMAGMEMASDGGFLGHREHGGFLYVRPTFQCLQTIVVPANPFYIAVLVHRWEVPWARIFPLRLMLRLGALYRYYPCPHVSVRGRDSVYAEIAQTIINFLADFRTYTYTLAAVRGLRIHMEERTMLVLVPRNRYDQVQKALANSSDHILALAGNFSPVADGHLVCIQNMEATTGGGSGAQESHAYSTQAVNIQGRQRRVTGASFLVLNGALKSASGLSAKCSIVEDGLMVQIMPAKMLAVQKALREMRDVEIVCGPLDGGAEKTEVVRIRWVADDAEFNVGVTSPIDGRSMSGVPSIRVHRAQDQLYGSHIIRWTEVFILQSDDETNHNKDPVDMSKLSEQIAKAAADALVDFLDLLAASGQRKIGLRATLHTENVSYEAGSVSQRLGPLYMNALDHSLIQTLHRAATDLQPEQPIVVELIFHILDA